jgi:predicted DNA-binding WGR domain protein
MLRRTDAERNMHRFYALGLMPTLFGEWTLLAEWGRIGSPGTVRRSTYADESAARIRADCPAVEPRHHGAPLDGSKIERILDTLCRHRGALPCQLKCLSQNDFRRFGAPMLLSRVRKAG